MAERPMNSPLDPGDAPFSGSANEAALLDAAIVRALEVPPSFVIPADFAARVASRTDAGESLNGSRLQTFRSSPALLTVQHHGRNAAVVSLCVLLAMIALFAHRSAGASLLWTSMEAIFCLQFALLAVWLVARDLRLYLSAFNSQG